MTDIANKSKENRGILQPAKAKLKRQLARLEIDQQNVEDHVKTLHDQLDARKKELLDEIRQHQVNLEQIQTQLKEDDYLGELKQLEASASAARDGGTEQALLTLPSLQASLPKPVRPFCEKTVNTRMVFRPEISLHVGSFCQARDVDNITLLRVWMNRNTGWNQHQVTLLPNGMMAIKTNNSKVILLDKDGSLHADSSKAGVRLTCPQGIAYHPQMNMLAVCELYSRCIQYLDTTDLNLRKQTRIGYIEHLHDVMALSCGRLAVHGCVGRRSVVKIYDSEVKPVSGPWNTYITNTGDTAELGFICNFTVDNKDNIYVSSDNYVVQFDKKGRTLRVWETEGCPRGLAVHGDLLLVGEKPGNVVAYNIKGEDSKTILTLTAEDNENIGRLKSLATYGKNLAILGSTWVIMYRISPGYIRSHCCYH